MKKSIYKKPSSEVLSISPHNALLQASLALLLTDPINSPTISEDFGTGFLDY